MEEGKVVADGATPLLSRELDNIKPKEGIQPNLLINFLAPAVIVIGITIGTYVILGSAKTLEAFVVAVAYQFVTLLVQKMATLKEMIETAIEGIKSVMSAILILAMAYCINSISGTLGTASYVISITESWMTPTLLLVVTYLVCAFISFFTGTSWGVFAIMVPIAVRYDDPVVPGSRVRPRGPRKNADPLCDVCGRPGLHRLSGHRIDIIMEEKP